ncbi:MAG: TetR/AcrR family transcriptional regulator [Phenylobacterium sp.]|uniref:TetR/AcrR family transcriptional regulator n=1 Tax=Phenylobacterium sp. TaxID=1871053 RepID=UPI0025DD79AC|nr:TetR/AcrR family transcriptional regulator [Phenylobacterium sp.]MBA4012702.1 TetR/AcrR family transcriptional regulator [Phenylobacterium sp.]
MNVAPEASSRERILEAALDLFARQGFAATSMRQIGAAVGMRAPSLYNHFAGKDAILSALIDAHGPANSAGRLASPRYRALAEDPAGFCRQYAADSLDQWLGHDEMRFMELLSTERGRLDAHRAQFVDTLFETEVGIAADYFRGFALRGQIHAPDPKECARLFMAGLTFVRMQFILMPPAPAERAVIAQALDRTVSNFLELTAPRPT